MRKLALLSIAAVMILSACGSNSSTAPASGAPSSGAPGADASCSYWCGNGSAAITMNGATTTISGGGCLIQSGAVDARFGDWWNGGTATAEVAILAYQTGTTKPTISGRAGGVFFLLGDDAKATAAADGSGTFSGTNTLGSGTVSGTWTCK